MKKQKAERQRSHYVMFQINAVQAVKQSVQKFKTGREHKIDWKQSHACKPGDLP